MITFPHLPGRGDDTSTRSFEIPEIMPKMPNT